MPFPKKTEVVHPTDIVPYLVKHANASIKQQGLVVEYLRIQANYDPALRHLSGVHSHSDPREGYFGRIWIAYSGVDGPKGMGSGPLEASKVYTGTGGYGAYHDPKLKWQNPGHSKFRKGRYFIEGRPCYPCSWDGRFYLSNFPGIKTHMLLEELTVPERHIDESYIRTE